jgi:hypothetical protein
VIRALAALLTLALLGACAATPGPAAPPPYTDLSQAFVEFYDRTEGLDDAARVAAFKDEVAVLYLGFYSARGRRTDAQHDQLILANIERFPEIREKYMAAQQAFPAAYARAIAHFRQFFPDSTASVPTYFLHSLGEMDGGTREIDGTAVMIFGADGIAQYHTPETLGPFFDHELFHVEHGRYFPECEPVWCSLWIEGLATAAAEQMNPGIDPRALMLETPRPIASTVDPNWSLALCTVSQLADSTSQNDYKLLFYGNGGNDTFAPRWGYYVGWKLARRALERHELRELAHMPPKQAEPLVRATLAAMIAETEGCPTGE